MKWRFIREKSGQVNYYCLESDVGNYFISKYNVGEVSQYVPRHKQTELLKAGYAKSFDEAKAICEEHYAANQ